MSAISSGRPNEHRTSSYSPETFHTFKVLKSKNGSYRVSLRFGKKIPGNFLYYFINNTNGKMYVGETRRLGARLSAHLHTANKSGQPPVKVTSQKLYAHLWENPDHFEFGIVRLEDEDSPRKKEVEAIAHYSKKRELYNRNRGGGGPKGKDVSKENEAPKEDTGLNKSIAKKLF